MSVGYTRRALAQIAEAIAKVAADNPSASQKLAQRIETVAGLVSRYPRMGRPTALPSVRVFAIRPYAYLMFYRIEPKDAGVTVLRVRHMAREADWRTGR